MSDRNAVQRAFDKFGKNAALEKKSGLWYRSDDEIISVTGLQKSNYGPTYFLNQGFWIREFGDERYPKDNACHIRGRLGSLLPPDASMELDSLLDLSTDMSDDEREDSLVMFLVHWLLPVIQRGSTVGGLRRMFEDGVFKSFGLRGEAQLLLRS